MSDKRVLNVGAGVRDDWPIFYKGWTLVRLDIDPACEPDIVADARELAFHLQPATYDAVLCMHTLEHFYRHEAAGLVLPGFMHILKPGGRLEIHVPDIRQLMNVVIARNMDLDDVLYESTAGLIHPFDVLYGFQPEIIKSKQDYFMHRAGYSTRTLGKLLMDAGFTAVVVESAHLQLIATAHKKEN